MTETLVRTEAIRIAKHRKDYGSCLALANSIRDEGLRHPLVVWSDGTLISGERRLFAALLHKAPRIQATFVSTIEEAAKAMLIDKQDDYLAVPMKWSEACRLWQTLRRLDAPAAVVRADESRRRGVALRKETQEGRRRRGRYSSRVDDYFLTVVGEPFGISSATARRVEMVYEHGFLIDTTDEKRERARQLMAELDAGASIWSTYQRMLGHEPATTPPAPPKTPEVIPSAPASKQLAAWERALPLLEGTFAGMRELGPVNDNLTWEQVGPFCARLAAVRREMEKMIRNMKEKSKV
jgi:ParB-like nuclease family protein